jgi:hypothetical protein
VKGKTPAGHLSKNNVSSTTNTFLNVIIILLSGLVIFLAYSFVTKITALTSSDEESFLNNTSPIIQIEVLNGCGIGGVADKFTAYLREQNFDVVQVGNFKSFDIDNTLVVDRTGNKNNAFKVAEKLGIDSKNVVQQINNDYFLDVTLIVGKDFNKLKPYN